MFRAVGGFGVDYYMYQKNYHISDIKIKNPDNPAQLLNAKLITFKVSAL
jgi:hypothetical protein